MKKRGFLVFATAAIGSLAVVACIGASRIDSNTNFREARASVPTGTRRIFLVNNHGDNGNVSWWTKEKLVLHVWNDTETKDIKGATEVLGTDFYKGGLWYVDISIANATSALHLIAGQDTNGDGTINWDSNNQTWSQDIPAYGTADLVFLNNDVSWDSANNRNNRGVSVGTSGLSSGQLAALLAKYNTCDSSNTYGYNAYPQLKVDFLDSCEAGVLASTDTLADYDYQEYINNGKSYDGINKDHTSTIVDKIAGLKYWYELNNE